MTDIAVCPHTLTEHETAFADGMCSLCAAERWKAEAHKYQQVIQSQWIRIRELEAAIIGRRRADAEFAEWLDNLPANLKARVNDCAFRYGFARKALKAARNNEVLRQRVDDRRIALHHALDAALAWGRTENARDNRKRPD